MSMNQGATGSYSWFYDPVDMYVAHVTCVTTEGHVDVCGLCCYLKPC